MNDFLVSWLRNWARLTNRLLALFIQNMKQNKIIY